MIERYVRSMTVNPWTGEFDGPLYKVVGEAKGVWLVEGTPVCVPKAQYVEATQGEGARHG